MADALSDPFCHRHPNTRISSCALIPGQRTTTFATLVFGSFIGTSYIMYFPFLLGKYVGIRSSEFPVENDTYLSCFRKKSMKTVMAAAKFVSHLGTTLQVGAKKYVTTTATRKYAQLRKLDFKTWALYWRNISPVTGLRRLVKWVKPLFNDRLDLCETGN